MEKIIILSFLFACVVLVQSGSPAPSLTVNVTATSTDMMPSGNATATVPPVSSSTTMPVKPASTTPKPTSGVVNVKAFAGFVSFFALIALF